MTLLRLANCFREQYAAPALPVRRSLERCPFTIEPDLPDVTGSEEESSDAEHTMLG